MSRESKTLGLPDVRHPTSDAPDPTALVFDVQRYAVHDGPGIRTLVFLKGCPMRCAWCSNPESQDVRPEVRHLPSRCAACGRCVAACPSGVAAVGSVPAKPGNPWPARAADRDACLACDALACVSACPEAALRVVGAAMTADQVVARAARDLPFYRASGGGLTLSGGEPLLHPAFVAAVIAGCRDRGIPVIVETCGDVPPEALDVALDGADQVYLDLKVADPDAHARWTGRPNDRVLASLARAASRRAQALVVRVPLVPGVNDSPEALAALARLVAVHRPAALHLVPYHGLGVQKYVQTARRCAFPESAAPPSAADLARAAATFRAVGLPVTIDG